VTLVAINAETLSRGLEIHLEENYNHRKGRELTNEWRRSKSRMKKVIDQK